MRESLKNSFLILAILALLVSCNNQGIDDKSKRNEHWAWWVDAKTGEGKWIPVQENNQIQDEGYYTLFFPNGNIFEKGKLNKGEKIDTLLSFNIKGQPIAYKILPDTSWYYLKDGPVTSYYGNGKKCVSGTVKNHLFLKDKVFAYFESGNIYKIRNTINSVGWETDYYENGNMRDSVYQISRDSFITRKMYQEDGTLEYEMGLKDGIKSGIGRTYYNNGGLQEEDSIYINGILNGIVKHFYENGKLEQTEIIIDEKKEGLGYFWYETGKIKAKVTFKNGDKTKIVSYHENGNIDVEGNILNDKPDGEVKHYDESGKLIAKVYWKDGQVIKTDKY